VDPADEYDEGISDLATAIKSAKMIRTPPFMFK
jgi:hypothetical protein